MCAISPQDDKVLSQRELVIGRDPCRYSRVASTRENYIKVLRMNLFSPLNEMFLSDLTRVRGEINTPIFHLRYCNIRISCFGLRWSFVDTVKKFDSGFLER
ncbi:hypothetical protein DFR33_101625 [Bradymonas sediminis]|nr:hypothetical protein DFR33_101625 [Bradymonas sediminis]